MYFFIVIQKLGHLVIS